MFNNPLIVDIINLSTMASLLCMAIYISIKLYLKYKAMNNKGIFYLTFSALFIAIATGLGIYSYIFQLQLDNKLDLIEFTTLFLIALGNIVNFRFYYTIFDSPSPKKRKILEISYDLILLIIVAIFFVYYIQFQLSILTDSTPLLMSSFQLIILGFSVHIVIFFMIIRQCSIILRKIDKEQGAGNIRNMRRWAIYTILFDFVQMPIQLKFTFNIFYGLSWILALIATYFAYRIYISRKDK
ncbi:MAG: hypothetical protein ACTSU2_03990 [Promethearchaeota archaeon]